MGLCTKPQENGATPPDTTLQAALAIVEKKVRNLEKRKGKLDAYRDTLQRGKSLNEDQQAAVAKYDEVIGTLEFARELSGQFTKLALDEAKDKKKMMKKEQQQQAAAQQQQQAAAGSSQQDYQNMLQQRQAAEKRSSEKFASSYNSAFDPPQSQTAQKVAP